MTSTQEFSDPAKGCKDFPSDMIFSGQGFQVAEDFLHLFEYHCEALNVPSSRRGIIFGTLLREKAQYWFLDLPREEIQDFSTLSFQFLSTFGKELYAPLRDQELKTRFQSSSESVEEYTKSVEKLAHCLKLSDRETLSHYLRGLLPDFYDYVWDREPKTFIEAQWFALKYEARKMR